MTERSFVPLSGATCGNAIGLLVLNQDKSECVPAIHDLKVIRSFMEVIHVAMLLVY